MRITRSEATDMMAEHRRKMASVDPVPVATGRFLDQAVIATKHLTGHAEWDVFLQRIQALIDFEHQALAGLAAAIANPTMMSEEILRSQRYMVAAKHRIEAWETVLALPKELLGEPKTEPPAAS